MHSKLHIFPALGANVVLNRTTGVALFLCYSKHKTSAAEVGPVQAIVRATMLTITHTFDRGNSPKTLFHHLLKRALCVNTAPFFYRPLTKACGFISWLHSLIDTLFIFRGPINWWWFSSRPTLFERNPLMLFMLFSRWTLNCSPWLWPLPHSLIDAPFIFHEFFNGR